MTAWDIAVVGGGPAGTATAIGALRADPSLKVAILERADFPRAKSCGDGIAPQVVDLLTEAGVTGIVDDWTPVPRLRLTRGSLVVDGEMQRPTWVVPRTVFDHRLVTAAQKAGAVLVRHRVRSLSGTTLDETHSAQVIVGADGPHSVVRRSLGLRQGPMAVAIRGYAPTPADRRGRLAIVFGDGGWPVAVTIGNDVSSRDIEGANPLYIPQAKIFAGACALGPVIRPAWEVDATALEIRLRIERDGAAVVDESVSTGSIARPLTDLVDYLFRAENFPDGAWLSTGTGIVPPDEFTLRVGDRVTIEVQDVGSLSNPVMSGRDAWDFLEAR